MDKTCLINNQQVKNDLRTYDNVQKIANGKGGNYTICCLLDYPYPKEYYKMIVIDLSKQQVVDVNVKSIQKIDFTGILDQFWSFHKEL